MNNNDFILKELKEITPAVANIDRRNVYTVPSGYFYELAERVLVYVKDHADGINLTSSATPFAVPQGYFEGLSKQILSKVKSQPTYQNEVENELSEIAPILNTINKAPVFTVPEGYFENLSIKSTENKSKAKVVSLNGTSRFIRYAAAAAITGVMAIGGIFYINNQKAETAVSAVTKFNAEEVTKLSDDEIIEYLNANSTEVTSRNKIEQDAVLRNDTKTLTEQEIIEYLKENPEPGDIYQQEG